MPSWTTLTTFLTLSLLVFTSNTLHGLEVGCRLWDSGSSNQICCKACHSGNRLVHRCGADPKDLCTPCRNGTFAQTDLSWSCDRCTQCADPQILLVTCDGTADNTVCGCKTGYKCADAACSMCMRECGRGEQPYRGRCEKCPEGTFNNQIHHQCIPWTKCPSGQVVVTNGTSSSDNKCGSPHKITTDSPATKRSHTSTSPPAVPNAEDKSDMSPVWIIWGLICSLFAAIAVIFVFILRQMTASKAPIKTAIKEPPKSPAPVQLMLVEQEDCSFCQPQQEQGSLESLSTQDSMEKLLPPV